ncbi:hypothetical protein [Streptomyces formicae]|uniref:Uncharacterized protein n=1 Tax=Streptomyces formicae TaxID=1616117 RepID=A0ABY3WU12_9ACTN|nr:hypothetical protein [Streptomyces formicae]UNM14964.1 hypothetical protein J4032_28980 [Streptomyces formicae]
MNATDPQLVLTPVPPGPAAGSKVTLRLDFRLHRQPVTQIVLSLPVGGDDTDLLADESAGRGVKTRLGTDEYTKSDKSKAPVWQIDGGKLIGKAWTYTLTPAKGSKTDHLTLTLADISLNSKPSDKSATANATITASIAIDGQGTKKAEATILKSGPGLALDNFCATGNRKGEDQNNPVMVLAGRPFRLTWTAKDADSFNLAWGTKSVNLPGSQRSYPPDPADTKAKLAITEATSFKLTAHNTKDPDATKQIFLTVPEPDGEYTDLTVIQKLALPSSKSTTHEYWLNKELTLTAPSDGYYTISLTTHRRLLGVYPPTPAKYPEPTAITVKSPDYAPVSYTVGNTEKPLSIFAAKDTSISLTGKLASIDDWTKLTQATVTWTGALEGTALPPVGTPYDIFPIAVTRPIYNDTVEAKWSYDKSVPQVIQNLSARIDHMDLATGRSHDDWFKTVDAQVTIAAVATPSGKMEILAWLTNENKINVLAYGGGRRSELKTIEGEKVTGYGASTQVEKSGQATLSVTISSVGLHQPPAPENPGLDVRGGLTLPYEAGPHLLDSNSRTMTTLCQVATNGEVKGFCLTGEYRTAGAPFEGTHIDYHRDDSGKILVDFSGWATLKYDPQSIAIAESRNANQPTPAPLPSTQGWEPPMPSGSWKDGARCEFQGSGLYVNKDGIFAGGNLLTPETDSMN